MGNKAAENLGYLLGQLTEHGAEVFAAVMGAIGETGAANFGAGLGRLSKSQVDGLAKVINEYKIEDAKNLATVLGVPGGFDQLASGGSSGCALILCLFGLGLATLFASVGLLIVAVP